MTAEDNLGTAVNKTMGHCFICADILARHSHGYDGWRRRRESKHLMGGGGRDGQKVGVSEEAAKVRKNTLALFTLGFKMRLG